MPKISAATIVEHRAQTRHRILRAVATLTRTHGVGEISMTDVATAAGITRTALYNYFPDKPSLLMAFADQATTTIVDRYQRELPRDSSAAERLAAFIRLQLEGIIDYPHPTAAELGAGLGRDIHRELAEHAAPIQRILVDLLREGTSTGEFDPVSPDAAAGLTIALVGSQRFALLQEEVSLPDAHHLVSVFALKGLGVDAETAVRASASAAG